MAVFTADLITFLAEAELAAFAYTSKILALCALDLTTNIVLLYIHHYIHPELDNYILVIGPT